MEGSTPDKSPTRSLALLIVTAGLAVISGFLLGYGYQFFNGPAGPIRVLGLVMMVFAGDIITNFVVYLIVTIKRKPKGTSDEN